MAIFTGSGVAIITPFDQSGDVNYKAFAKLIDFQIENGTDSIIVCGTTGEASTLTDEEQIETVRFAVSHVAGRVPVIGGAGSNHTEHGIELCKALQQAGVDGLLLVTPYYNKTTQKGLITHYTAMASAADLPIILYNVPSRTGLNILPKTAQELSKIENIVAIKEATGDLAQVAETAHLCEGRLDIYSGNDDIITPVLSLGGKGVISVLANVAPQQTHDMCQKFFDGDTAGAAKLQLDAMPLIKALFCEVNPIPVKAALNMMGYEAGGYRMPLCEMEPANYEHLRQEMASYGLIK